MSGHGLTWAGQIVQDGKLHRFKAEGDHAANSWYVLFPGKPFVAGAYGCWKRQFQENWSYKNGERPSRQELATLQSQWKKADEQREADEKARHGRLAEKATEYVTSLPHCGDHLYFQTKNVPSLGAVRIDESENLVVLPLTDGKKVWSYQTIDAVGDKLFMPGGRVQGCFYIVSDRPDGPVVICEGYATGASIHLATGWATVCAMNCGNILATGENIQKLWPGRLIVIAADNDRFTDGNPGVSKARVAADKLKCKIVIPEFPENDLRSTDFNDLQSVISLDAVRSQFDKGFPAPITILSFDEISLIPTSDNDRLLGDHLWDKGGPLVIAGSGGTGKTRLYFQLMACAVSAKLRFLNLDLYAGAKELRWLVLQTENSVRRLKQQREILRNFIGDEAMWNRFNSMVRVQVIQTDQDGFVNLDDDKNVARILETIERYPCDAIVFDSLYDFGCGDLNKDVDMRATCTALSRIIRWKNPKRAAIITHHSLTGIAGASKAMGFDRASFGRNSKVLYNWTRGQINIAPISEDSNEQLSISCAKCSDGREFQPFAVKLNMDTLIYECDETIDVRQMAEERKTGKKGDPLMPPARVRELCELSGSTKQSLAKAIREDVGCATPNAYRYIRAAEGAKQIIFNPDSGRFFKG